VIEPQALDKLFANNGIPDTRGRMNHNVVLGRTKNGTMFLTKTDAGIGYEIFINPHDPEAVSAYEKVRRKDVDGASFMFTVAPGGEKWEMQDGIPLRRVQEIDELMDVGPVTFPAYPQASANARSKVQELRQQQQAPTAPEGTEGESLQADQKAAQDDQTLQLMAMELEIDQTKE
jgi:HK97 family phage prohead protease